MGSIVLDTSIVVAVLDRGDIHHRRAVDALREARARSQLVVLPASVLAECLVGAYRVGAAAVKATEAFVASIADRVHDIDAAVAREAARLRAQHRSLLMPDAFVIAVGVVLSADSVLTADARWAKIDSRVRVITGRGQLRTSGL